MLIRTYGENPKFMGFVKRKMDKKAKLAAALAAKSAKWVEHYRPSWENLPQRRREIAESVVDASIWLGNATARAILGADSDTTMQNYKHGKYAPNETALGALLRAAERRKLEVGGFIDAEPAGWGEENESGFSRGVRLIRDAQHGLDYRATPLFEAKMRKPVPLLGTAAGAESGSLAVGLPEATFDRPLGLVHCQSAYALLVRGTSMEPRLLDGEMLVADPEQLPVEGELCIVQVEDGGSGEWFGYVKEFRERTPRSVVVLEYQPRRQERRFPSREVRAIHRVVPWKEVFGV